MELHIRELRGFGETPAANAVAPPASPIPWGPLLGGTALVLALWALFRPTKAQKRIWADWK